jgi:histidinol-phosphate aminotransferase
MNATAGAPRSYMPDSGMAVVKKVMVGEGEAPLIDLSLNESSYGASPAATAAAIERSKRLERYPDPASTELRGALSETYGYPPEQLVCGNGSEELLDIIARIFARPGDEILFCERSFLQFPIVTARVGATPVRAPERELAPEADALIERISSKTKILFLGNPDNPTGRYMPAAELERLVEAVPAEVLLVIDSAYAEYAVLADDYTAGHEFVTGRENVVVTRTFSKAFGLAAVRVGWAHGSARIVGFMNRMRGIGNVNALAQETAKAALSDLGHVRMVAERTAKERARLTPQLEALGLSVVPGAANFLLVKFPPATNHTPAAALAFMAEQRVILRSVDDYGLTDYLRITIGLPDENDALVAGLKRFMV